MEIRGTIFERLADMDEIIEFGICEDRKIYGGKELGTPEFVARLLIEDELNLDNDYLFISAPLNVLNNDLYVARFIRFRSTLHKNMWIATMYKFAKGLLHESAQEILN